ncbi:MAG: exonuclease SbcCD subunit D [Dehalococcoidia bacterium]
MSTIRFIHAADLHLDSPFRGIHNEAPENVAKCLVEATFGAYERIIDLCLEREVEALLVAGDIYDGADRSLRAQIRFANGLRRLDAAGIRSFVCHGNHDPLDGWQARLAFPASCFQFPGKVTAVPFDPTKPERATVVGISYPTQKVLRNLVPEFGPTQKRGFSIGLLHCNVGGNTDHDAYAPCTLDDLRAVGLDYWALGHVHTRQVLSAHSPTVVYPGNSQGRNPRETGSRGVYVVEADELGQASLEFVETAMVRWESAQIDIQAIETEQDLLDAALGLAGELLEQAGRDVVYRLALVGRGDLNDAVRRYAFSADLRDQLNIEWSGGTPFAWCEQVDVRTSPALDRERLRAGADFVADLLRLFDEVKDDAGLLGRITTDVDQLYNHARIRRALGGTGAARPDVADLLAPAEAVSLEHLQ